MRNVAISLRSVYSSANTDECSRANSLAGALLVSHRKTTRKPRLSFEISLLFKRCEPYNIFLFPLFQNLQTHRQDWFVFSRSYAEDAKKKKNRNQNLDRNDSVGVK